MAEEAAIIGPAREIGRGVLIEPGAQIPAIFLCVPGERQFDQLPGAGEVEVGSRVIARADHVSGIHLESVDLRAGRAELIPALDQPAPAPQHLVVTAGAGVMDRGRRQDRLGFGQRMKRTRHADVRVSPRDFGMALLAARDRAGGNCRCFGPRRWRNTRPSPKTPRIAAANPASAQRPCVKGSPPGIVDRRRYHLENARNARALDRSRRLPLRAGRVGFLRLRKLRERTGVRAIAPPSL